MSDNENTTTETTTATTEPNSVCECGSTTCSIGPMRPAPAAEEKDFFTKVMEAAQDIKSKEELKYNTRSQVNLEVQHENVVDILAAAGEVEAIHVAELLKRGRIAGGTFDTGGSRPCGCLFGTILMDNGVRSDNLRRPEIAEQVKKLLGTELMDENCTEPAEQLFMSIERKDRPSNSAVAALVHSYITELEMSNPRYFKPARRRLEKARARFRALTKK